MAPRRLGPYAPLSAYYADDDAVIALDRAENDRAELLYLRGLAYCARDTRLDGYISDAALEAGRVLFRKPGRGRTDTITAAATELVRLGMWAREDGGYRITAWAKWNRLHAEIEASRRKDLHRKGYPVDDPDDSTRNGSGMESERGRNEAGTRTERTRNDDGTATDSSAVPASRAGAPACADAAAATALQQHDNATARHGTDTSTTAAAARPAEPGEEPPLPPELRNLQARLADAHITVAWDITDDDQQTILAAVNRCGEAALVRNAQSRHQPNNPAFSVRAFLGGWSKLPPRANNRAAVAPLPAGPKNPKPPGITSSVAELRAQAGTT